MKYCFFIFILRQFSLLLLLNSLTILKAVSYKFSNECPITGNSICECVKELNHIPSIIFKYPPEKYLIDDVNPGKDTLLVIQCGVTQDFHALEAAGLDRLKNMTHSTADSGNLDVVLYLDEVNLPTLGTKLGPDNRPTNDSYFDGYSVITHLVVRNVNLIQVPPYALAPLTNLQVLTIAEPLKGKGHEQVLFQQIISAMNYTPKLNSVHLHLDGLEVIPKDTFSTIVTAPNIRHLTLSSTALKELHENSFTGLINLEQLTIISDKLGKIPWKALKVIAPTLNSLVLTDTTITRIDTTDGKSPDIPFPALEDLNLNDCNIHTIPNHIFSTSHFAHLKKLSISHNDLAKIQDSALESLQNLRQLEISDGNLQELNAGSFKGLKSLEVLNLPYSRIKAIKDDSFDFSSSLRTLDLRNNDLLAYNEAFFNSLPNLVNLDISNNYMNASLPARAFAENGKLQSLKLSHNNFPEVPFGNIGQLTHLRYLDLSANLLFQIPHDTLLALSNLTHLDFTNNKLMSLPFTPENLEKNEFGRQLKFIGLSENPWLCDCKLQELLKWIKKGAENLPEPERDAQTDSLELAQCEYPSTRKGVALNKFVYMEDCSVNETIAPIDAPQIATSLDLANISQLLQPLESKVNRVYGLARTAIALSLLAFLALFILCVAFILQKLILEKKVVFRNNPNPFTYQRSS